MLCLAHMKVVIPHDADPARIAELQAAERETALTLQRAGTWAHLWRVVGRYENYSVFDVASNDELHAILSSLPLFPYMEITLTPLAGHPSALPPSERG